MKLSKLHARVLEEIRHDTRNKSLGPFKVWDARILGACIELAAGGHLISHEKREASGNVLRWFTLRNPLKNPMPGDRFECNPVWPDGRPKTKYELEIKAYFPATHKERFVYGIKRGRAFFSYSISHQKGVTMNQEVGGMVGRLKNEKAKVIS